MRAIAMLAVMLATVTGAQHARADNGHLATTAVNASPNPAADLGGAQPSPDVRYVANWVTGSDDNGNLPFVIVDKAQAHVFVFDADGRLRGDSAVLLGLTSGDDSAPGIGERPLSSITQAERTTPAGRFVAALGHNLQGKEILWVDYAAAISMHSVVTANRNERRAQRLATLTAQDNRITYGCINVPLPFYKDVISPTFSSSNGIVYVLPENRPVREIYPENHAMTTLSPNVRPPEL